MKKRILIMAALIISVSFAYGAATATVEWSMTASRFYTDAALTTTIANGSYVEIILQSSNIAYNEANYATYLTVPGIYNGITTIHESGKYWDGSSTPAAGMASIKWEFTDTQYTGWYAAFRFYDSAGPSVPVSGSYGVSKTWYSITAIPSEADPRPTSADQVQTFGISSKDYTKYDVPAVPEPATMALFGLGGLALMIRRKLRKEA